MDFSNEGGFRAFSKNADHQNYQKQLKSNMKNFSSNVKLTFTKLWKSRKIHSILNSYFTISYFSLVISYCLKSHYFKALVFKSITDSSFTCTILSSGVSPPQDPGGSLTKAIPWFCPGFVLSLTMVYRLYFPDTSQSETSQLLLAEFLHRILFILLRTDCLKPCLYQACVFQILFFTLLLHSYVNQLRLG